VANEKTQLDRIEDLVTQLISLVANQQKQLQELQTEFRAFKAEMLEFKAEMQEFRSEANRRFDILEGQAALVNQRMDYQLNRIAKVEEEIHLLKTP
jgi:hypothetical protein